MKLISIKTNILHTQYKNCLLCLHIRYTVFYIISPWRRKRFKICLFTDDIRYGFYSNKNVDYEIKKEAKKIYNSWDDYY
jgi:hypothetical protein